MKSEIQGRKIRDITFPSLQKACHDAQLVGCGVKALSPPPPPSLPPPAPSIAAWTRIFAREFRDILVAYVQR